MTDPLRQPPPGQQTAAVRFGFAAPEPVPEPEPGPPRRGPRIPAGPRSAALPETDLIRAALRHRRR
jgi:hypothetical protein